MLRPWQKPNAVASSGAGPPGAAAASLLSKAGADFLVLEQVGARGPWFYGTTQVHSDEEPRPLRELEGFAPPADPKAKLSEKLAPGGPLTNQGSAAFRRFFALGFRLREARAGEEYTWPIGYAISPAGTPGPASPPIAGGTTGCPHLPAGKVRSRGGLRKMAPPRASAQQAGRNWAPMPYAYGAETTVTLHARSFTPSSGSGPERLAGP